MTREEREDAWTRRRRYLGSRHPDADSTGYERLVTYAAGIPADLAAELDRVQRRSLGINASKQNATRANLVRSALRLYLNTVDPDADPETIEGTAVDLTDAPVSDRSRPGLPRSRHA